MATIPEQYESQRVGVQGYRVLNLDLDGVCADYKGAIRDYLQRQGIDVPERALQTAHYKSHARGRMAVRDARRLHRNAQSRGA